MKERCKHALCTLFNSLYADKGIVLYQSLEKVSSDFTLYVLAMDDKCYDILSDLNYTHLVPVRLSDFEDKDLLKAKANRPFGQYCWTCSSSFIKYVLNTFRPDYCTYLDADMMFYTDPYILIEEMEAKTASVSIVGHRFGWYAKKSENIIGKYCVECNTFKDDKNARDLLDIWINQCLTDCSQKQDGIHWGDQKYMDNWVSDYPYVIESDNLGAGIAPWNIPQYKFVKKNEGDIMVKCRGSVYKVLFYHFEGITYKSLTEADIHVYSRWGIDDRLVDLFYKDYLVLVSKAKKLLSQNYNVDCLITSHPALQKKSTLQKYMSKIQGVLGDGIVNFIWHVIPRSLFYKKDIISF